MTATVLAYLPSPDQGVWHLGPVPVRAYALCILVGIVAALILGDRRWTARGGGQGVIYDIALWAVPFGLVGGRLYHVITDWSTYFGPDGKGFGAALRIWDGGLGIWGAVALGGIGAWIACRRRGIPLPAFGDAVAPGIVLAQAIGRLGNYFNQELYGRATTMPWGLEVYERRNAAGALDSLNGVSTGRLIEVVHPTFLYELIWNLLVFAVLIWVDRRFKIGHGRLFALYVAGYCMGRFWIELMRSDYATTIADTGIRVNTFTSTFVFIGAVVYIMLAPKGREDPETLKGNDYDESLLDEVGEELTVIAATSGVVAAAAVAGAEDRPEEHESEAAAEAEHLTEEVATAPSEDIEEAETFAAGAATDVPAAALDAESLEPDVAETEVTETADEAEQEADDAEPAAEAEVEPEAAIAVEGTEVAEALEAEPDELAAESAPEEGLGSVDGAEVVEAQDDVAEVHEAAVEGEREAETLAEDVASEDAEVEPEDTEAEVAEAQDDVAEVHEAAVEGEQEAETLAEDLASEDTEAEPAESEPAESEDAEAEAEPAESEGDTDTKSESDETGADEVVPEEGLGSVEGAEVAEAQDDVAEVHEAAVEGEQEAESLAEDLASEDTEPEAEDSETETEAAVAEGETDTESESDESGADEVVPEEGLGSVDGAEVAEAQDDVAEVHEAAVEGEQKAETLAEDLTDEATEAETAESEDTEAESDADTESESDESAAEDVAPEESLEPVADEAVAPEEPRRKWWRRLKG